MKLHRHLLLLSVLLFFAFGLIGLQGAAAEQNDTRKMEGKGRIAFEFPWIVEAKVEVNLTAKLINLASKSVSSTAEEAALIQMLDGIYVRTYDRRTVDDQELVTYFRQKLEQDKWEVLFKIQEYDETVEINLLFDEDMVYGIFVILIPEKPAEITFVNIVGKIDPNRVEDLLRNLSNFGAMDINVHDTLREQAVSIQNITQREMLAVKINYSPTIDGTLDDACWKIAPHADGFTHASTRNLVEDDSVVKMVYTSEAIYVGWHLYDSQPDKIVARQIKDDRKFVLVTTEDWVSFTLDPFHTHQHVGRKFFMANPLGTKNIYLPGQDEDDSKKWIDRCNIAAKIVEDGWVVEMEIPWGILDYPETTEPIRMGINFERIHARTGARSWWSNIEPTEPYEDDGHWRHVLPPPKSPDRQGALNTFGMDAYSE